MKQRLLSFFEKKWVDILTMTPLLLALCYFLYGRTYFVSLQNFGWITLPWIVQSIVSSIGTERVCRLIFNRFQQVEDGAKRVFFTTLSALLVSVGSATITYLILGGVRYKNLIPGDNKFYVVLIFAVSYVFISGSIHEGVLYYTKWKAAISEAEQLEKLNLESQFRSLQSQLNPHFLFNSFNVLSSLISESPARAEQFVDELSNVYRYLLRSNEHELATIGEELRFIRSFFHLLETRHDKGISLEIKVNKGVLDKKLPALALQVLVENAVKHNEISPEKPLKIEIGESGDVLFVRNNIQQKTTKPLSNRVGLENLRQRYKLLGIEGFGVNSSGGMYEVVLPLT